MPANEQVQMKRKELESSTSTTSGSNIRDETTTTDSSMIGTSITTTQMTTQHTTSKVVAKIATPTVLPFLATDIPISLPLSSSASKPQLVSPMDNVDILRLVVSFIGQKHYRFIAIISQSFHSAYAQEFPKDTTTKLNASTIEYAKICWEELKQPVENQQYILSHSAAFFWEFIGDAIFTFGRL